MLNVKEAVEYVKLQGPKGELILKKTKDGPWRFVKPEYGEADEEGLPVPEGRDEVRQTGVGGLLTVLGTLQVESEADFAANDAGDKDLAKYGVAADKPSTLKIEIKRKPSSATGAPIRTRRRSPKLC